MAATKTKTSAIEAIQFANQHTLLPDRSLMLSTEETTTAISVVTTAIMSTAGIPRSDANHGAPDDATSAAGSAFTSGTHSTTITAKGDSTQLNYELDKTVTETMVVTSEETAMQVNNPPLDSSHLADILKERVRRSRP